MNLRWSDDGVRTGPEIRRARHHETPVSAERWDAMTSIFAAAVPYLRADPMWDSPRSNPSFLTLVGAQR